MAVSDAFVFEYEIVDPTAGDLSGFKVGSKMRMKRALTGTDLNLGSIWIIKSISGSAVSFAPARSPSIHSARTCPLDDVKTHFDSIRQC